MSVPAEPAGSAVDLEGLIALEARYVMQTYRRAGVEFVRGEGTRLWDSEGREYLDFLTGISVCSVGHCNPSVVGALTEQAGRLMHVSNLFYTRPMVELARRLSESCLGGPVFFCNSGAEANECAIKVARKHAHRRGIAAPEIVSFQRDFHGRTYGALSATPGFAADPDLAPMLPGFRSVAPQDPRSLAEAVGESTAAVLIEPIQGEAGVYPVADEVLLAAREACARSDALLILDEVQTGIGRTGSLWAYEQTPIRPDLITSAKALGGGFPIGACIASPACGGVLEAGDHGSTFAGGPVAASAALAVLEIVDDPGLLRRVRALGARLTEGLEAMPGVDAVRGRGLMLGVALSGGLDAREVCADLLEAGLVVNAPEARTLRLLPPLTVSPEEVDRALHLLGGRLGDGR
ncbi:MAG: acetylornithine/succinylornithine family transaminase [Solirubrobacterales bacterium]